MDTRVIPFAFTLANSALETQRIQFELNFNLLQNSLINRFNEEVEDISQTPAATRFEIEDLTKRQQKLIDAVPSLESFRQGNANTKGTLETIFEEISTLFSTYNQDSTVDAAEVAAFEAQRDIVAEKIENLFVFFPSGH